MPTTPTDFRARLPRFSEENRRQNQQVIDTLHRLAAEKKVSPAQMAIACVLAKGDSIVPVIGARKRPQLTESLGALDVTLSRGDVARIEEALPSDAVAGSRCDGHQMQILDSERGGSESLITDHHQSLITHHKEWFGTGGQESLFTEPHLLISWSR